MATVIARRVTAHGEYTLRALKKPVALQDETWRATTFTLRERTKHCRAVRRRRHSARPAASSWCVPSSSICSRRSSQRTWCSTFAPMAQRQRLQTVIFELTQPARLIAHDHEFTHVDLPLSVFPWSHLTRSYFLSPRSGKEGTTAGHNMYARCGLSAYLFLSLSTT